MREISKKLGLRIKELREKRGLTQLKPTDILGMEASNLSKIERGVQIPKEESLEKLTSALGVETVDLFDYGHIIDKNALIKMINQILEETEPEKVSTYYKILKNL